ncbi:MAG: cytochrome c-type biogenesis protein CcmH [Caldilineaceae bacterium]|nr:cytochrome c-type biogenesis protein CcmH [Caldilineaceae bacterium]
MGKSRSRRGTYRWSMIVSIVCLGIALTVGVAWAQEGENAVAVPTDVTADQVNEIARELWCPLCSGVRLDSCELKACEQMKDVIAIKLSEGEDLDSIRTYFVAQYGPQVLGEPPLEGFNWLAWILPFVVLAIGGYVLWMTVKRMTRSAPTPVTAQTATNQAAHPAAARNGEVQRKDEVPHDDYEAKLAEELKRYG